MLFIGIARHTAENCPAGIQKPNKEMGHQLEEAVKRSGAKLIEIYLDAPGHTFYAILDADSNNQLWDATEPLRLVGDVNFTPVLLIDSDRERSRAHGSRRVTAEALGHARDTGVQR